MNATASPAQRGREGPRSIVLCGSQHHEPQLAHVLRALGVTGPVAAVTAGWQEREAEPGVVPDAGVPVVDLRLHARSEKLFAKDVELSEAYKARQLRLKLMQDFYRIRLDHAEQAARAVAVRSVDPELIAQEWVASLELIRHIDQDHLQRCGAVHDAFDASFQPRQRPELLRHIAELRAAIEPTQAIVIAGGHVAVLLNRLRLFGILELVGDRPIVAWSAGAMALTERVVLFHEDPPQGRAISEVLEPGLGLARDLVVLPEPRQRLHLGDAGRVGELAQRYAPAACIAVDHGAQIWVEHGRAVRAVLAQRLDPSGTVEQGWSP